jgi:hypothetical protein
MNADELRQSLSSLAITQLDLARLLGVTSRAVSLWATDERGVPGPAAAYLRLLLALPKALQAKELATLKQEKSIMCEGMYLFTYQGHTGVGLGMIVLTDGHAFGTDTGVQYDGTYAPSPTRPGFVDLQLKATVPPGIGLVQGVPPQPVEYRFDLNCTFPARGSADLQIPTPFGAVRAQVRFLRDIPAHLMAA